jgi:hypothetical protein
MIGRYDKKIDVGTNRVNDGFTVVTTQTSFVISTVLKGDPMKFLAIDSDEYRYQVQNGTEAPRDAVFSVGGDPRDDGRPRPGDTVLLFLKKEGESYILADESDGMRKLDAAAQAAYSARIGELNSMFERDEPESIEVAKWLVRCAADPITRWDGTHELMTGFRHIEWRKQRTENEYQRIDPSVAYEKGAEAAGALTDELKSALTQILLSSDFAPASGKKIVLSDGDRELIALVKRWAPATAARYLVDQLKSKAFSLNENAGMMYKVAALISDTDAEKISDRYAQLCVDVSYYTSASLVSAGEKAPSTILLNNFIRIAESKIGRVDTSSSN